MTDMQSDQVQIRKANEGDIPAMACLWADLVLEENPEACPQKQLWGEQQRRLMRLKNYHPYVTVVNGVVVGFATGFVDTDLETGKPYLEGGHMYVAPLYRKGRAGALLHRMGIEVCRKHGVGIFRRHVPANNERMMSRLRLRGHIVREYTVDERMGG